MGAAWCVVATSTTVATAFPDDEPRAHESSMLARHEHVLLQCTWIDHLQPCTLACPHPRADVNADPSRTRAVRPQTALS
eukprot:CAMPEP_0113285828 /NCGR_PEP_ID=MMETSP0008_2-20120614/30800_1 /TAXON_ID=97485 /ORGANISM="Prymnesium parvum" /LENGTH=78 /DNA_ID=CAMNT_0000136853 /DNA_START=75 /DNA_END=308 /DNA_ORIENTATION=- /assembly_acc=CAM_ASM_000153